MGNTIAVVGVPSHPPIPRPSADGAVAMFSGMGSSLLLAAAVLVFR